MSNVSLINQVSSNGSLNWNSIEVFQIVISFIEEKVSNKHRKKDVSIKKEMQSGEKCNFYYLAFLLET